MSYQLIQVTPQHADGVALVRIARPKELNALNLQVMTEIAAALTELDAEPAVRAIVLTGDDRAFAAGADIKEMAGKTLVEMLDRQQFREWARIDAVRKPVIAAVSGFCLGGGCELAMRCDIIIASETAQFGQPEIKLGVIPGAGGTQRLTHALGKSRAMELILTGDFLSAEEALKLGLVSRVTPAANYLVEATRLAKKIAAQAPIAVRMAKESVKAAYEVQLTHGMDVERRNFYTLFATEDQKEGMAAFVEKREAKWGGK